LPLRLVATVELAFERGTIRSCTPDLRQLLPELRARAARNGKLRYTELSSRERLISLQLILALFLAAQRGTAAAFAPYKHIKRFFEYYQVRDTALVLEDLRMLFSALGRMEVNGTWWRPARIRRAKSRNMIMVDFKAVGPERWSPARAGGNGAERAM